MPPEDDDRTRDVVETPKEPGPEKGITEAAREGQERPQDMKDMNKRQEALRKLGRTASSMELPRIDLLINAAGDVVAKFGEKVVNLATGAESAAAKPDDLRSEIKPGEGIDSKDIPPVKLTGGGEGRERDPGSGPPADLEPHRRESVKEPPEKAPFAPIDAPTRGGSETRHGGEIEEKAAATKPKEVKMEPLVVTVDYKGEGIKREIPPSVLENTAGKTLKDIAKEHLGKDPPPTDEEIQKHVKEIAKINHIKNPDKPLDGTPITLPGHDKHGGFVTRDAYDNQRTLYQDGAVVVTNKDGSGYDYHQEADGSYKEHHWGPRPQDNYELRKTADGKYEVADAGKDNFKEPSEDALDPRVEKAKLHDLAESRIADPVERAKFEADLNKFSQREKDLEARYEKQGMKPEEAQKKAEQEMAKTYQEIGRLMDAPDNPKLPNIKEKDRIQLAEQVMHQAADPTDVSQGTYNTCNVATIESRTYDRNPSEAARLVTDIVTTGKYTTNGTPPTTVEVGKDFDPGSLDKLGQSKDAHTPGSNHRSYASQIFEVTAVNIHYAKENAKTDPPGKIRYEQHKPGPDIGPDSDNGERLYDYSMNDPKTHKPPAEVPIGGKPDRSPGLSPGDIAKVCQEISSDPRDRDQPGPVRIDLDPIADTHARVVETTNAVLVLQLQQKGIGDGQPINLDDPAAVKKTREAIDSSDKLNKEEKDKFKADLDKLDRDNAYRSSDGRAFVKDEQHLNEALAKMKAEGRLPIIVGVHTGTEPFTTDAGEAGARGGNHVVTITEYNPGPPPTVSIDNQWDKSADHKNLPVSDLFNSMRHRDEDSRIADLQKDVDANRRSGNIDYTKETELLFQKRAAGKLTDQELEDGMVKAFDDILKARKAGKLTEEQRADLSKRLTELRSQLPPDEQKKVNDRLKAILKAQTQNP